MKKPSMNERRKTRACEKGHSLVETMVALAVFTIFTCGVGASLSAQWGMANTQKRHALALAGCQQTLQTVTTLPWDTMTAQNGATFTVDQVPGTGTIAVSNDLNGDGDVGDPNESTTDLYRVTVTIYNTTLTTYRTKEGI